MLAPLGNEDIRQNTVKLRHLTVLRHPIYGRSLFSVNMLDFTDTYLPFIEPG